MADWLSDPRPLVTRFAEGYIHSVENDIALAQRSAEADIAMRRLDHDEPPIDPTKINDDENN